MKKKSIKRELRLIRRVQRKLWKRVMVQSELLDMLIDADDGDDPYGGYEILADPYGTGKPPKLKVVGE